LDYLKYLPVQRILTGLYLIMGQEIQRISQFLILPI